MFSFVVHKFLSQIPRILPWHTQFFIIISKKTAVVFTAFCISNFLRVVFIPNIIYCIITVWNFRSINNFSIFSPDMIILYFWKDCDFSPNNYFNESVQFFTFTDSLFIFPLVNNDFSRNLFYLFIWTYVSPKINIKKSPLLVAYK